MCVIVFSKKGVDAPDEEKIRQMFAENPDGAGYAYNGRNGKVFFKKGFMCVEDLLKELKPLDQWKNTNLAIHFRIGTSGENDKETCHPFLVSSNYADLRRTSGEGAVLFHNGIIGDGGIVNEKSSDTQDFVVAFAPLLKKYNKSKAREVAMNNVVEPSKILVMYDKNKFNMYGKWQKDGELYVSNKNYMKQITYSYGYNYGYGYTGAYTGAWWDDDINYYKTDGEYEKFVKRKESKKEEEKIAEELWNELEIEDFIWVEDKEKFDLMMKYADEYSNQKAMKNGRAYWVDKNSAQVWAVDYV